MIKVSEYGEQIELGSYKGKVQLTLGYKDKATGTFKALWAKREFKKGGDEKSTPIRIPLGDTKEEAVQTLLALLAELQDEPTPF